MTAEIQYRAFTPDLQVRASGDGRTVHGIAVPWNKTMRINDYLVERFARGAFNAQISAARRVAYARDHLPHGGKLIGSLTLMRDDASGLYVEMRVSRTPAGDETLELIKDGALRDLSIGFRELQNRHLSGGVVERVTAHLTEVASVLEGAYGDLATAGGVRSASPMAYPREVEDANLRPGLDEAQRILASLK